MNQGRFVVAVLFSIAFFTALPTAARGDGGTVRARESHGGVQVSVFTSPTPLRVGIVDVSVLVQDLTPGAAVTGATVTDAEIEVVLYPVAAPERKQRKIASSERVINQLLRAAEFELFEAGEIQCEVIVRRPQQPDVQVRFQAEVAPAPARWVRYWPWFTWPAVVVAWFVLRRRFARRGVNPIPTA